MKTILLAGAVIVSCLPSARAFSLAGPVGNNSDAWQVSENGFGTPRDTVAPKNLGEGYRRNTPVMYYACDRLFLGYFDNKGVQAINSAFAVLNALTNVSSYSSSLNEFSLSTRRVNYQAQTFGLFDLKSYTLGLMMEQLGLANPVLYVWGIHDDNHVGNIPCPVGMEYLVVQRNFDYFTSSSTVAPYSAYINNTLYTYYIVETCSPPNPIRWAQPYMVDTLAQNYTPVASYFYSLDWGGYYTGLTRDDVAGLRYLMRSNNINVEAVSPDSQALSITTNLTQQLFPNPSATNAIGTNGVGFYYFAGDTNSAFGYGDLAAFSAFVRTNDQATVQAAYPGVVITSVTNNFIKRTNVTYSYTYEPPPYGSTYPPTLFLTLHSNLTEYMENNYYYQFANIFTNRFYTNVAYLYTTTVGPPIGSAYGSASVTNSKITTTNLIAGDFFVLPIFNSSQSTVWSNLFGNAKLNSAKTNFCPLDILYVGLTNKLATTNFLVGSSGSNSVVGVTNTTVGTSNSISSSQYLVTYSTNYTFVINPVTCGSSTNVVQAYRGIENIKFVLGDFDETFGQFVNPITNYYALTYLSGNKEHKQLFERVLTVPDFIFSCSEQVSGPHGVPIVGTDSRNLNFDQSTVLTNRFGKQAGPGIIFPSTTISFEKAGPVYFNVYGDVTNGTPKLTQLPGSDTNNLFYSSYFYWASFDGTTNAPTIYPNTSGLDDVANHLLITLTPATLHDGNATVKYDDVQFAATGGSLNQPYTWSAINLPDGMSMSPTGLLSGKPTEAGTFVITVIITDINSRAVQWQYSLTITE